MRLVAPGFEESTVALATDAARWLMISPVVLAISAVAKAALQAERAFALPALSPRCSTTWGSSRARWDWRGSSASPAWCGAR